MFIQANLNRKLYLPKIKKNKTRITFNKLYYGSFGLRAKESGYITLNQIEAARKSLVYAMQRKGRFWVRSAACFTKTSKGSGARMGKGKGSLSQWLSWVSSGQIFLEVEGPSAVNVFQGLLLASRKFNIKSTLIKSQIFLGL